MDIWSDASSEPSLVKKSIWLISFLIFIFINICSSQGWLGPTNAEVSRRFQTVLTPTGWTFSIWGGIFVLQALGTLYIFTDKGYEPDGYKSRYVNILIVPNALFWSFCTLWQFMFVLESPTGMLLATLFIICAFLSIGYGLMRMYGLKASFGSPNSFILYLLYVLPTSISTAWLSMASGVQLLIALSAQMQKQDTIGSIFIVIVTLFGVWTLFKHKDTAYGITLLWAFVGVYEGTSSRMVKDALILAMIVVSLGLLASVLKRKHGDGVELVNSEVRQPLTGATDDQRSTGDMEQGG